MVLHNYSFLTCFKPFYFTISKSTALSLSRNPRTDDYNATPIDRPWTKMYVTKITRIVIFQNRRVAVLYSETHTNFHYIHTRKINHGRRF